MATLLNIPALEILWTERNWVGYSLYGCKKSYLIEWLSSALHWLCMKDKQLLRTTSLRTENYYYPTEITNK